MRFDYAGRVLFVDEAARGHTESVHAIEIGETPFPFLSVWTKGQVAPFRETEHDPELFHVGDAKLSWVDDFYRDRAVRALGYKQHFHVRTNVPVSVNDLEAFKSYVHPDLWTEAIGWLAQRS